MKPRVVITHWVHEEVIRFLEQSCEVIPNDQRESLPSEEILRRTRNAHGVIVFMPDSIDDDFLSVCPDPSRKSVSKVSVPSVVMLSRTLEEFEIALGLPIGNMVQIGQPFIFLEVEPGVEHFLAEHPL